MKTVLTLVLFALVFAAAPALAEPAVPMQMDKAWLTAPATSNAPGFSGADVKAVYFDGLPWQGKPTRVFAWVGLPKPNPENPQAKVPGMVLIHGGGGTAFDRWVRIWTGRGYAAIAMDTCGQLPIGDFGNYQRDAQGGPPGWGGFDQIDQPVKDQWTYHAVADTILAHSLLRAMPQVDPDRIGVTGISWGGYLTCIVAGVDKRFKFAVPVFGCGFLGEDSAWLDSFKQMGPEKAAKWLAMWDPSVYLRDVAMPTLWVSGSKDPAYPLGSLRKSYHLVKGPRALSIRVDMNHTHFAGEDPEEIRTFADSILKSGKPLAKITGQGREASKVWATFDSAIAIKQAELHCTKDEGNWQKRNWSTVPAVIEAAGKKATATLPTDTKVFYLSLIDDRGMRVTTDPQEVK
jgi:dienelactone hydrolase